MKIREWLDGVTTVTSTDYALENENSEKWN